MVCHGRRGRFLPNDGCRLSALQTFAVRKISYVGRVATTGVLRSRERRWYSRLLFWQGDEVGRNELTEPFGVFITSDTGDTYYFQAEVGTLTDFASIPWYLRGFIPQHHPGRNAAFVTHDGLYARNCMLHRESNERVKISRKTADVIMRDILRNKEAPEWMVASIYRGIVLGGWYTWRKYRKIQQTRENNEP